MSYYFCVDIPFENTAISCYDTLEELYKEEKFVITHENSWYIIKGEELGNGKFSF